MAFNFCDRCGFKLTPNAKFCANCGAPVASEQDIEQSQVSVGNVRTTVPDIDVLASSTGHEEVDTQKIEEADTTSPIEFRFILLWDNEMQRRSHEKQRKNKET